MFREAGLQSKQGWTWFSLGDCDRGEGIFLSLSLNRCIGKQDVLQSSVSIEEKPLELRPQPKRYGGPEF